jgi:hypothetical protein
MAIPGRASLRWGLALLLVGAVLGCGPAGPVRVSGTATRNGKPVVHATIHFTPDSGRPSFGETDDKGRFSLRFDRKSEGVVVGSHRVHVEFRPKSPREEELRQSGELAFTPEQKAILEKYGKLEGTPLRIDVTHDGQVIELQLD